jgi:hypothetical protein
MFSFFCPGGPLLAQSLFKVRLTLFTQAEEQAQRPQRRDRIPLHHFLRLIGGGRVIERDVAADNDELVTNLKRSGVIIQ